MLFRVLRAERIKAHHAPVWLAFIVLPLVPAILGTANYVGNIGILENQWYSLWTQHTLFASYFFLPALLSVYCGWEWRLEHSDHNFNSYLTLPASAWALYLGKLLPAVAIGVLTQVIIGVLYVVSGRLIGLDAPLPPALISWLGCGAIGSVAVCAAQLFVSLAIRSFAVPVAIGLLGGVAGMMATIQGFGMHFPYSLLAVGMRANNPNMTIDLGQLVIMTVLFTVTFSVLTVRILMRRDVTE